MKNSIDNLVNTSLSFLNSYDLHGFVPIKFNDKNVGYIGEKNFRLLYSKGFLKNKYICIEEILNDNSFFFDEIFEWLLSTGFLKTNLREKCPVFDQDCTNPNTTFLHDKRFGLNEIFRIERSLLNIFGFPAYGVHMNGWMIKKRCLGFLMAKRSQNVKNFRGLFDNLVGGGQPSKISIFENLKKESFEEANLGETQLSNAKFSNSIRYMHTDKNNFSSSVIFSYNLELLDTNGIKNNDGEIESFHYFTINEIFNLLKNKLIKPNCILPILDFLLKQKKSLFSNKTINEIKKLI